MEPPWQSELCHLTAVSEVPSQNVSLDCVYLLGTGGLGSLPSPACMLNALKIQFWLSQVFLLARDGEGQA